MAELLPNAAENLIKLREICDASAKKIVQLAQVWPYMHLRDVHRSWASHV
jgi:hypothetical protein